MMNAGTPAAALWDAVWVRVTEVRHGLLIGERLARTNENSLFLLVRGKGARVAVGEQRYLLESHLVVHAGRGQRVEIDAVMGEAEYYATAYQAEESQSAGREMLRQLLKDSPFDRCMAVRPANAMLFETQFCRMAELWRTRDVLMLKSAFYAVVSAFCTAMESGAAQPAKPDAAQMAREYLEEHFAQSVSIQALADTLGMGRTTLYERFRQHVGQSPQQYVMELRLEAARRALVQSAMTQQEIAVSCGLIDKDYLSRAFKRRYGVAPGAYRREHAAARRAALPAREAPKKALSIENLGRIHRYERPPKRIVCLNFSAAEICAALGAADKLVGVAGAEGALADCAPACRAAILRAPQLPDRSADVHTPGFEAVCACRPDLVIGTSYSFNALSGIEDAAAFEQAGMHIYALKATYTLGGTFEDTYEDIANLGRILGRERQAEALIASMRERQRLLPETVRPVRVFSFDSPAGGKAFTCGCSLEAYLIRAAGGINVFENRASQFAAVNWEEVGQANPQVILVHRFFDGDDGEQKAALLRARPELAQTDAVRNGRIHIIGMKKVFPAIDNVETAIQLARWFEALCAG